MRGDVDPSERHEHGRCHGRQAKTAGDEERAVLLAHEAAHLIGRHHLYLQVAELAAAANPLLRPAASSLVTAHDTEARFELAQAA